MNLIVEVTGEKKKDKAAKVATARTLWVPAVNNHGGFGRWAFVEITDPWDAENLIRGVLRKIAGSYDGGTLDTWPKKTAEKPDARRIDPPQGQAEEHPHRGAARLRGRRGVARKTMLYPRDPSLDPQLVWKGKDEQDREDLAVPVVPIYIQEKIHPQAIIDDLLLRDRRSPAERTQLDLFADFNGLPEEFDKRVDFYHHDAHWSNRMILGDSLLVMTSLAEKEGLKGKVQTIYFDPPYGIKFGSNWQVSTRKRDVKDGKAEDATRQPEQVRAFRDTWKLGIHSYLAYLRDRLVVARELLTETGSVFVQIGDENVHLVRCVLDEVFGSENFVVTYSLAKTIRELVNCFQASPITSFGSPRKRKPSSIGRFTVRRCRARKVDPSHDESILQDGRRRAMTNEETSKTLVDTAGCATYSRVDQLTRHSDPPG